MPLERSDQSRVLVRRGAKQVRRDVDVDGDPQVCREISPAPPERPRVEAATIGVEVGDVDHRVSRRRARSVNTADKSPITARLQVTDPRTGTVCVAMCPLYPGRVDGESRAGTPGRKLAEPRLDECLAYVVTGAQGTGVHRRGTRTMVEPESMTRADTRLTEWSPADEHVSGVRDPQRPATRPTHPSRNHRCLPSVRRRPPGQPATGERAAFRRRADVAAGPRSPGKHPRRS